MKTPVPFYWKFGSFFAIAAILPALYARANDTPLSELGLGAGDVRFGAMLLLLPLALPVIYVASGMADLRREYPMCKMLYTRPDLVIGYEVAYAALFYAAWAFYFRGFLLFGLKSELGATNAVLMQTISSCLVHIGKPEAEILISIPAALLFGWMALRTRSIWYGWALHAGVGALTDLFILGLP